MNIESNILFLFKRFYPCNRFQTVFMTFISQWKSTYMFTIVIFNSELMSMLIVFQRKSQIKFDSNILFNQKKIILSILYSKIWIWKYNNNSVLDVNDLSLFLWFFFPFVTELLLFIICMFCSFHKEGTDFQAQIYFWPIKNTYISHILFKPLNNVTKNIAWFDSYLCQIECFEIQV